MSSTTNYWMNLNDRGEGAITIVEEDGRAVTYTHHDANFPHIQAAAIRGLSLDEAVAYRIPTTITRLSERVALDGNALLFDGKPVNGILADTVVRHHAEGRSLQPIVNFMENLADNVTERSRNELFRWLTKEQLRIDDEGYVIGFRGLRADRHSQHSGGAYVLSAEDRARGRDRGTWVDGHVPNYVGSVVSLPRHAVDSDSGTDCSYGLHVGSEQYARTWGDSDTTIVVRVHPADVVSVPEQDAQKMRVCRYEVLSDLNEDVDHEPAINPADARIPSIHFTNEVLDRTIPGPFRKSMNRTQRFITRIRRREETTV